MNSSPLLASIENLETSLGRATPLAGVRLTDVATFLKHEMSEVERIIVLAAEQGVAPGSLASKHLQASGGKRIRPMLVLLSTLACGGAITSETRELAAVSELVHMATLLHDDVLDDASERRGVPVARRIFGNAVSVLAGDLLLVNSLERAQQADPVGFARLLVTLRALVNGEIVQLRGRTVLDTSLATYERIVQDKTASLFAWAAESGARRAGAPARVYESLRAFGTHVGVAFQVIDDLLDYAGDAAVTGKSLNTDLLEGKITLPLVFAMERDSALLPLVEAVRAGDFERCADIAARVRDANIFGAVKAYAKRETDAALASLAALENREAASHLFAVASDLAARVS